MSFTESSFGARLGKARELLIFIQGFQGYSPPRLEENPEHLNQLVEGVSNLNQQVANTLEGYREVTNERQGIFRESPDSVIRILTQVRAAVEAQYGKKSVQSRDLVAIIRKIRGTKITKAPKTLETEQQIASVSVSQLSYGSLTQSFGDLISTMNQFNGFQSSNQSLTIQGLADKLTAMQTLNNAVATYVQALSVFRSQRITNYDDLKDRVQRIKAYVKAQYGPKSQEYNLIKGIKV
jgi:hypothetical protein